MSNTKKREVKQSMLKKVGEVILYSTLVATILFSGSVATGASESEIEANKAPEEECIQTAQVAQEMQKREEKRQKTKATEMTESNSTGKAKRVGNPIEPQSEEINLKSDETMVGQTKTKEEIIKDPDSTLEDLLPYLTGNYTDNLEILAHIIHAEAEGSSDIEQQLVGTVVIYRAFTSAYGVRTEYDNIGSLEAVIYAPNQYSESLENGRFFEEPEEECYRNAAAVLSGETLDDTPRNVLYQATFLQGDGVYMDLNNTFCYENDIAY